MTTSEKPKWVEESEDELIDRVINECLSIYGYKTVDDIINNSNRIRYTKPNKNENSRTDTTRKGL